LSRKYTLGKYLVKHQFCTYFTQWQDRPGPMGAKRYGRPIGAFFKLDLRAQIANF